MDGDALCAGTCFYYETGADLVGVIHALEDLLLILGLGEGPTNTALSGFPAGAAAR